MLRHANIEVTRKCNQRCFYCFNDSSPKGAHTDLSVDGWLTLLKRLQKKGLRSVHVTGGEPFLWQGTIPLLRALQLEGFETSILSNGYKIPYLIETNQKIFRRLTVAQISLDSIDTHVHDERRGNLRASHDAKAAIQALCKLEIPVEVSAVVDESNKCHVPDLLAFCENNDCKLLLREISPLGRSREQGHYAVNGIRLYLKTVMASSTSCVEDRFHYVPRSEYSKQVAAMSAITLSPRGLTRQLAFD